jgi:hypothetical protein
MKRGGVVERDTDVRMCRRALRKSDSAQMIGHDTVTAAAKRGEIARPFVAEPRVGAMVDFDRTAFAVAIANSAAETGSHQFSAPGEVLPPPMATDVSAVIHVECP